MARRREVVGKRIREARDDAHLTQKQLAVMVGVSDGQVISKWERGVNAPDYDKVELLAKALKRPVSYFFADAQRASNESVSDDVVEKLLALEALEEDNSRELAAQRELLDEILRLLRPSPGEPQEGSAG